MDLEGALETESAKFDFIEKDIDHPHRVGACHVVIQALGKQCALASMFPFQRSYTPLAESGRPPKINSPKANSAPALNRHEYAS